MREELKTACCRMMGIALGVFVLGVSGVLADLKDPVSKEDKDAPKPKAPIAQPTGVKVNRGQVVEVTLTALTSSSKDVIFLLRDKPTAGTLLDAEPVRKTKTSATVRYQSDAASKATQDSFRFAARLEGGDVSPSVEVKITVIDPMAQIVVPEVINVPEVRVGLESRAELKIENSGTGDFSKEIALSEPWSWAEPGNIEVKAGQTIKRTVVFKPKVSGSSETSITFMPGPRGTVKLRGNGLAAFVSVPNVILAWDPAARVRTAKMDVINPTPQPITVNLACDGAGLEFPKDVELPAGANQSVPLTLKAALDQPFKAKMLLASKGSVQEISIFADPAPAALEFDEATRSGVIDFGILSLKGVAETVKTVKVKNTGGSTTSLYGRPPDSFTIEGYRTGLEIAPGQELEFKIKVNSGIEGELRESFTWQWENNKVPITLRTLVKRAADEMPEATRPIAPTGASAGPLAQTPIENMTPNEVDMHMRVARSGVIVGNFQWGAQLPKVESPKLKHHDEDSITVTWKPVPGATDYTVLQREVRAVGGFPTRIWVKSKAAKVEKSSDEITATLDDLPPYWAEELRFIAHHGSECSLPTEAESFQVTEPKPFPWGTVIFYAALVTFIYLLIKRHQLRKSYAVKPRYIARSME